MARPFGCSPLASLPPTTWPVLSPPPATTVTPACGQCSRPARSLVIFGVRPIAPAPQGLEPAVLDPGGGQRRGEAVAVEVRVLPRAGEAADVGHGLDGVPGERTQEAAERVGRVADRVEFKCHVEPRRPSQCAVGSGLTRRIFLPKFSPRSSPISSRGAFSRPSVTSSLYLTRPSRSQPPTSRRKDRKSTRLNSSHVA